MIEKLLDDVRTKSYLSTLHGGANAAMRLHDAVEEARKAGATDDQIGSEIIAGGEMATARKARNIKATIRRQKKAFAK